MGKLVMIVGLIVIGVVAGFVVRLLIPGSRLSSASRTTSARQLAHTPQ